MLWKSEDHHVYTSDGFSPVFFSLQEQEENKGATSWPEFYIDQLNSMAAVGILTVL